MTSKDDLTAPSAVARELREIEMLFERLSYHRHALLAAAAHLDGVPSETANARELNRHATFLRRYLVRNSESEVAQTPEERSFLEACNFLDGLTNRLWPAHNGEARTSIDKRAPVRGGVHRTTAFTQWWLSEGMHIAQKIGRGETEPENLPRKYMEFGFIWGWETRKKQDAERRKEDDVDKPAED